MNISANDTALPLGSLVLVTGASGFIATHIVDQLLHAGFYVRGTVRSSKQVVWTTELFTKRHGVGKFSAVLVPEMSTPGAFDEAVKDVQGIIHTASNVTFSSDPNEVIPQTIAGVTSLLKSASKMPSVKSFVFTSSSMAAAGGIPGPNTAFRIDSSTWNDALITDAWSVTSAPFPPTHAAAVYGASKAEAEKAFWKFVDEEKPGFRVNAILPDANLGRLLSGEGSSSTGKWVAMVFEMGVKWTEALPRQWYVNVDDTARLHVAALVSKSVANQRVLGYAAPFTWNEILGVLRKLYPERKFDEDLVGEERSNMSVANEIAEELLKRVWGRGWTSLEETVKENVEHLV